MKLKYLYILLGIQVAALVALYFFYQAGLAYPSVMLKTVPIDPRDYLRGDFIILRYEISDPPQDQLPQRREGQNVFVILKEQEGFSMIDYLDDTEPRSGTIYLKGKVICGSIVYDIEKYFVPEGKGNPPLPLTVKITIRPNGNAQIKQLYSNGSPWPPQ